MRTRKPKWKMQRALGLELPGLGKPGALEKRGYPPGQHGPTSKRQKPGGYALQLREKQKLLCHYGLREEQLRRFVRDSKSGGESNWVDSLIGRLERRLDNLVFRLGLATSIAGARQLVSHGHVLVNGRRADIGSMVLRTGTRIRLTARAGEMACTQRARGNPRLPLPSFLAFEAAGPHEEGVLTSIPSVEHVPFEFNPALVAEYYARRGVK